jgi:hypothetical protein
MMEEVKNGRRKSSNFLPNEEVRGNIRGSIIIEGRKYIFFLVQYIELFQVAAGYGTLWLAPAGSITLLSTAGTTLFLYAA